MSPELQGGKRHVVIWGEIGAIYRFVRVRQGAASDRRSVYYQNPIGSRIIVEIVDILETGALAPAGKDDPEGVHSGHVAQAEVQPRRRLAAVPVGQLDFPHAALRTRCPQRIEAGFFRSLRKCRHRSTSARARIPALVRQSCFGLPV